MQEGLLKVAEIRGLKTGWVEFPNLGKPPLIMLHGYPDTPDTFSLQTNELSNHFHLILPFARGVGPSEMPKSGQRCSLDAVALDILEILRLAGFDDKTKVHALGHDLGAIYIWHAAEVLGDRLASLTIMGGIGMPQIRRRRVNYRQWIRSWYILGMQVPKVPEMLLGKFAGAVLRFAYRQREVTSVLVPVNDGKVPTRSIVVNPISHYRALFREAVLGAGSHPRLIKAPVLVIQGSRDAFVLPPTLDEFEGSADQVTVRILEGNHWIHRVQSQVVNDILVKFMESDPAGAKKAQTHGAGTSSDTPPSSRKESTPSKRARAKAHAHQ